MLVAWNRLPRGNRVAAGFESLPRYRACGWPARGEDMMTVNLIHPARVPQYFATKYCGAAEDLAGPVTW